VIFRWKLSIPTLNLNSEVHCLFLLVIRSYLLSLPTIYFIRYVTIRVKASTAAVMIFSIATTNVCAKYRRCRVILVITIIVLAITNIETNHSY